MLNTVTYSYLFNPPTFAFRKLESRLAENLRGAFPYNWPAPIQRDVIWNAAFYAVDLLQEVPLGER